VKEIINITAEINEEVSINNSKDYSKKELV
jgi:hypothetical protein